MAGEIVLERFLNAQGKRVEAGDEVPDENEQNLAKYRSLGLIGKPTQSHSEKEAAEKEAAEKKAAEKKAAEKKAADKKAADKK